MVVVVVAVAVLVVIAVDFVLVDVVDIVLVGVVIVYGDVVLFDGLVYIWCAVV